MSQFDPGLFKTKKQGDPISAREWNALVKLASRELSGPGVVADDLGWTILERPAKKQIRDAIVTCEGPNGETSPTDARYWMQFLDVLPAAPGTPEPAVEVDGDDHDIVIATNEAEIPTGTHGLRVGTVVPMWQVQDLGGNLRWVFCFLPAVFAVLFGGMFNAYGMQRCDNFARLDVDAWSRETITTDWNEAEQGFGVVRDVAWFEGTLWAAGNFTLPVSPSGTAGYGLAYYDQDTEDWVGVVLGTGEHGGTGYCLYVWDDGSGPGPRLFYGQVAGSGPPPVALTELVAIQFNADTKVVTVDDIGWITDVGGGAIAYDMLAWDDGQGGGEKLYIVGWFLSGASFNNICTWNGTAFAGVDGGTASPITELITSLCIHEFGPEDDRGDGSSEKLVVCGKWSQIGAITTSDHCAKYNPFTDNWEKMGQTELTLPANTTCMSVASFNGRVWVAKGAIWDTYGQGDTDNFAVLFNGPEEDWRSAYDVIKDIDNSGATNGFSTTWWDGENNVRVGASVNWLTTYQGRLHLGGNMSWRSASQGQAKTGPLAWWEDDPAQPNARYGWWRRTLPLLRGEVHVLMNWQGGLLVGGNYTKGLPRPGAGFIRNLGLWRDPGGVEELGTWEAFGTGVVGTVYCAAIFNGQLYIGGDIIEVDGVAVKGVARFDGENWHYVANFSDYGTVLAMTVHGNRLIVGGDFIKADGQPSLKILCAWTGTRLEAIIADIDALDGFPIIRALHSHGGYLYAGGWFDEINDGGAVTAHSVARMDSGENWEALEHDDAPPPPASEGLATGFQCYSISSHTPYGLGNDWIYCGTDGDARPNGTDFSGDEEGLWRWNPSSPEWAGAIVVTPPGGPFNSWAKTPVRAMIRSANNDLWVGLQAKVTAGEAGGEKHQVWWFQPNDNEIIRYGGPSDGIWESDILALAYTDVGAGPKIFGAGNIQVVGTIDTRIERPCQLITSIGADDRVVEVAGGLGVANYMAQFTQDQFILRMREIQFPDVACSSLVPVGVFGTMNDGYSEYVVGIDLRNRLTAVAGGLTRPLSGVPQGVADIQLLDNPIDWGLQPCEHNPGFWWIMCGGYDYALNRVIRDDDAGLISESIHCYGIIAFDGMYYRRLTQNAPIGIMRTLCMFKGSLLSAGWSMAIVEYTGTPDSGSWDYLADPITAGNIYDANSVINRIRHYPEFSEDELFVLGYLFFYPTVTDAYAFSAWNGTTFTKEEPPGFAHTVSVSEIPQLYTCCLGDLGSGVRLFCGGKPSTANARPVVVRTSGGSWSALGPSSGDGTLRGVVNGLALVRHPSGPILYATGESMEVEVSAAWISCAVAKYDPSTGEWEPIGAITGYGAMGVPAAVADHHGYDNVCDEMYRFITGGAIGEIANQTADLGTGSSVKVWGMAQYREPPIKWQAFQPGGGVNGFVVSAETAGEKLYGPPAPLPI